MINSVDKDGNGTIEFPEFKKMMKKIVKKSKGKERKEMVEAFQVKR